MDAASGYLAMDPEGLGKKPPVLPEIIEAVYTRTIG
jgi:hypothetical protein